MTQEEEQLLFIDLCTRLPYKTIGRATWTYMETNGELKYAEKDRPIEINDLYDIWSFKPYLRPMSSLTEEEANEFEVIYEDLLISEIPEQIWGKVIDWLNSHYFDYRDLIGKGLALPAPKGLYPY